ncbi:MAG TPA: HAMP domain-containing histidine kinase [bacterium]|nr:HAMP domain-containing histidine kinase [bacterium]
MKRFLQRFFGGFKGILFVAAFVVAVMLHLYSQRIIEELRTEARVLVQFYAQMVAKVADTDAPDDIDFIFNEIILRTKFPLIYTDANRRPAEWKGLSVAPSDRSPEALERVGDIVKRLDREIEPVEVRYHDTLLGYLYYGDSNLINQLQWLPYLQVGFIGLFILVGFIGYANIMRSEQRYIWVGMAKETAHQLGTPLSSLLGWLEVLRTGKRRPVEPILDDMERDLDRLEMVSRRFSQIGSRPNLKETDISEVLKHVAGYIRRRTPQTDRRVEIREFYEPVPRVALNPDIFQWAVENLLKNSLDAMDKKHGLIEVRLGTEAEGRRLFVEIRDNGRGMDKRQKRRVFHPGYSTKKRGWGLGLSLSKRIVEDYHGGLLYVRESHPGEGTVMRLEFKVPAGEKQKPECSQLP